MTLIRFPGWLILLGLILSANLFAVEYKVAVRAMNGIDAAVKQWQPTIDILNTSLPAHHFSLIPIISLEAISKSAGQGEADFILSNPSSYIEIQANYGAIVLATLNNRRANTAQNRFGSVIFTHVRNEDILTLHDLKNKKLIAVSESAFGGWRVAWLEMLKQGFNPHQDVKALMFTKHKTQEEVVWAVRDAVADVGVVRTDLLERLETAGKIDMRYYRVINNQNIKDFPFFLSSELYPEWPFIALTHVPAEVTNQVGEVLMNIASDSQAAQTGQYVGWTAPQKYDSVKKLMQRLAIAPDEKAK